MAPMRFFSTVLSHYLTLPNLELGGGLNVNPSAELSSDNNHLHDDWDNSSSAISLYSYVSEQSIPWSFVGTDEVDCSPYVAALDLANVSLYSYPSSRTLSTDYGVFYTRLALSQETVGSLSRRRSYDSIATSRDY